MEEKTGEFQQTPNPPRGNCGGGEKNEGKYDS